MNHMTSFWRETYDDIPFEKLLRNIIQVFLLIHSARTMHWNQNIKKNNELFLVMMFQVKGVYFIKRRSLSILVN